MLLMLLVVVACGVVLIVQITRFISRKKLSRGGWITACIAFLPVVFFLRSAMIRAVTEYNPSDATLGRITGHHLNGATLTGTLRSVDRPWSNHAGSQDGGAPRSFPIIRDQRGQTA